MMRIKKIISMISAAVIAASMSAVTAVPASAASDSGWKTAYSTYLKKKAKDLKESGITGGLGAGIGGYSICDLDQNGTPELIENTFSAHVGSCEIYTCENGKMKLLGDSDLCDYGEIYYDPSTKVISAEYLGISNQTKQYKIENGKLVMTYYSNDSMHQEYYINEKKVTEKEYNSSMSAHHLKGMIRLGMT